MHFSSGINRPPYEASDGFLQITSGCSHGKCEFCTFYKDSPFKLSPMEEIESDIKELMQSDWDFDRIYLQGADPFIRRTEDLIKIADLIHYYLPQVRSIGGYARVDNLKNKTVEQLKELADIGYGYFYFGVESGDDKLLDRMHKGYHADFVLEQCRKMDNAGMPWIGNFLGGLGGHNWGLSHARETAKVYNQLKPAMIYASELTLFPDTPLSADVAAGKYEEATETERIQEMQEFIRCLNIPTIFRAEHVTMPIRINGRIPEDKDGMINKLQKVLDERGEESLHNYRRRVSSL
ncbi:radical SAM protein [Anaerovibrio sp.]|uniref:radical SAM protein n=1 Tax=Anaerovibrio sp. TaxID=1872532 RepID=UPI0025E4048B|nr:radical SAM protein [Anaerovibrio sp.]